MRMSPFVIVGLVSSALGCQGAVPAMRPDASAPHDAGLADYTEDREPADAHAVDDAHAFDDAADTRAQDDARAPEPDVASAAPGTSALPPVTSVKERGAFEVMSEPNVGPSGAYTLVRPASWGARGERHPVLVWGPGALSVPAYYQALLEHVASHGFVVLAYGATPDGPELTAGLDWLVTESARADSPLAHKLDLAHVAVGGHSAGSLAAFRVAADPRWTTTLHLQGGTFDPHTDVANLRRPAAFFCGSDDIALPNCAIDFENTEVPTAYGVAHGADHMAATFLGSPEQQRKLAAVTVAWLRFQLADEPRWRAMFLGADCDLCTDPDWTYETKNF